MESDHAGADDLSFPLPPRFHLSYTDEAFAAGTAPPPPAPRAKYSAFGQECDATQSYVKPLAEYGIDVLYDPNGDRIAELRKLNHRIMAEFVSIVKQMSEPDAPDPASSLERLELLFTNAHHALNEFRPHQGHETLRAMMERQLEERDAMVAALKATFDDARGKLAALAPRAEAAAAAATAAGAAAEQTAGE